MDSQAEIPTLNDVDTDRLAGREYEVTLSFLVEYTTTVVAGPTESDAKERARDTVSPNQSSPTDWDLVNTQIDSVSDVWMDDVRAPKAATWLDEPHVPSEETFWNDERHFD